MRFFFWRSCGSWVPSASTGADLGVVDALARVGVDFDRTPAAPLVWPSDDDVDTEPPTADTSGGEVSYGSTNVVGSVGGASCRLRRCRSKKRSIVDMVISNQSICPSVCVCVGMCGVAEVVASLDLYGGPRASSARALFPSVL